VAFERAAKTESGCYVLLWRISDRPRLGFGMKKTAPAEPRLLGKSARE